ncbi:hypothetical protein BKA70DRAFT_1083622, partial [Coprinopsis sp. MPI-PUGE-AT-0042]
HYSMYIYPLNSTALIHADSLHHPPHREVQSLMNLFTEPLPVDHISSFITGNIEQQGVMGGGGSCGIAAMNFAQVWANASHQKWTPTKSREFRLAALEELVVFHFLAESTAGTPEEW